MSKFVAIMMAVGAVVFAWRYFREDQRRQNLEFMTADELLDAVLRHEITLAEVPARHRTEVMETYDQIQFEMNSLGRGV